MMKMFLITTETGQLFFMRVFEERTTAFWEDRIKVIEKPTGHQDLASKTAMFQKVRVKTHQVNK